MVNVDRFDNMNENLKKEDAEKDLRWEASKDPENQKLVSTNLTSLKAKIHEKPLIQLVIYQFVIWFLHNFLMKRTIQITMRINKHER